MFLDVAEVLFSTEKNRRRASEVGKNKVYHHRLVRPQANGFLILTKSLSLNYPKASTAIKSLIVNNL